LTLVCFASDRGRATLRVFSLRRQDRSFEHDLAVSWAVVRAGPPNDQSRVEGGLVDDANDRG